MPKQSLFALIVSGAVLVLIAGFGVRQYDWNVSAFLHMDRNFGAIHDVPSGVVLYEDGGYDGMAYYQIARDVPALFSGGNTSFDSPYRFQRIVTPLLVYVLTLGNVPAFPAAFLFINLLAALGSLALILSITKKLNVHALAIVFNPAVLVGILFSLTEPVSLFFLILFFRCWKKSGRQLDVLALSALTLSLFARETTVFLIGLLLLWFVWKKQWKDALLMLLPVALFILWQYFLTIRFGAVGFQAGGNIVDLPFYGPITVIRWAMEQQGLAQLYRLSSVALLCFLLPLCAVLGKEWIKKKRSIGLFAFLLSGLSLTMLSMDAHMWGVITSIGRVVTPFYPLYVLYASERDTTTMRALSVLLIAVSLVSAIGIAAVRHPFILS